MSNKAKSKRFPLHGNISMYNFAVSKLQHDAFCKLYVSLMACVFFFLINIAPFFFIHQLRSLNTLTYASSFV